ncbi:uncharacterized protein [Rutidosis leptorrhynchoides]|uniref:uncharacterized protein isoform X6 n=1 Tax=Rutidosis leptorrhynchoides TaxID=125765 RepID=UPI003A9A13AB
MKVTELTNGKNNLHQGNQGTTLRSTSKTIILVTLTLIILTVVPLYYPLRKYPSTNVAGSTSDTTMSPVYHPQDEVITINDNHHKCDVFSGEWIPNPDAPYYDNMTCWAIHEHQNCQKYGRPDSDFMKWRWKPDGCDLPIFNPYQFLEIVRDKSLAFVGDSVGRNQMQSLICMLSRNSEVTTNKELSAEKEKVTKAERIATEMKREYETMKRHYENCNSQRAEYKEQVKVLSFRETRHLSKIDELVKEKEKLVEENNILKEQLKAKEENEKRMITGIPALVERVFNCQALSHKIREFVHLAKSAERLNFFNFMKKKLPELPNPLPEVITSKINENAILEADEAGASIENIKFSDLENLCKRPDVTIDDVLNYTPQNE